MKCVGRFFFLRADLPVGDQPGVPRNDSEPGISEAHDAKKTLYHHETVILDGSRSRPMFNNIWCFLTVGSCVFEYTTDLSNPKKEL